MRGDAAFSAPEQVALEQVRGALSAATVQADDTRAAVLVTDASGHDHRVTLTRRALGWRPPSCGAEPEEALSWIVADVTPVAG